MEVSILQIYFNEINQFPIFNSLLEEDKLDFLRKAQQGIKKAKNKIIEAHLRLIPIIARKFIVFDRNQDFYLDLIQEGNLKLCQIMEKIEKIQINKNLSGYIGITVEGAIKSAIAEKLRTVPITKTIYWEKLKLVRMKEKFQIENNREPSCDELAKILRVSVKKIKSLIFFDEAKPISLNILVGNEGDKEELYTIIEDTKIPSPIKIVERKILRQRIKDLLKTELKFYERQVILKSFFEQKTGAEMAKEMKVKRQTVWVYQVRALKKLKKAMKNNILLWKKK